MTRPLVWYPLAGSDPVPGDPGEVEQAGRRYQEIADAIQATARQLKALVELGAADSRAVDEVRGRAETTAEEIGKAETRYSEVGRALVEYAAALRAAQESSLEALSSGQSAQRAVDDASMEVSRARWAVEEATNPQEQLAARGRLWRARNARDDAETAVSRARMALDAAVALRDQAAARAVEAIRAVTDSDGLSDGWWENWGRSVATSVSHVAGLIAQVAGTLAFVLAWVPVVGQALALVAGLAGVVALIADIALLVYGEGSWAAVLSGFVGVASFGLGRVVIGATKVARSGLVKTALRRSERLTARSGNPAVRSKPRGLAPERLRPSLSSRPQGFGGWVSDTRDAWAQVRSTGGMDRVRTFLGGGDLVADRNALAGATRLIDGSPAAKDAIRQADTVLSAMAGGQLAGVSSTVSSAAQSTIWVQGRLGPAPDVLGLAKHRAPAGVAE